MEKRDLVLAAVASIGFLVSKVGNRLGAVIIDGQSITVVPARQGRMHLMSILHRVQHAPRRTGTSTVAATGTLASGLRRLSAVSRRRGLAVVITDLLGPETWPDDLRRLAVRHEVLVAEIVDPRELELPTVGLLTLSDPETGRTREINTGDARLRRRYAQAAREERDRHARTVRNAGADHLVLRTDSDWLYDIVRFVALRRKRQEVTPAR
jgi:uncharacterized protein (DUF58 family)